MVYSSLTQAQQIAFKAEVVSLMATLAEPMDEVIEKSVELDIAAFEKFDPELSRREIRKERRREYWHDIKVKICTSENRNQRAEDFTQLVFFVLSAVMPGGFFTSTLAAQVTKKLVVLGLDRFCQNVK